MNKESSVGRILSIDEAMHFFERCIEASKVMEELTDMMKEKRVLRVRNED